jgi:aryl-alcohol dehydrogenase-like predicted oxidoreductase
MRYRILGKTGLRVSVIGVGTWQFGGEWGRDFSQAEADAILDAAAECGINFIGTAECYGDHLSERLVGDYLARRDRSRWLVATKFGHHFNSFMNRTDNFFVAGVRRQLEASLKALRVETIDLYQFHSGPDELFQNEKLWTMLAEQKRASKIRHLGVSILGKGSEGQAREALRFGVEALQVVYNRLDRRPEQIYFPHAQRDNLGILARVPLASGLLSGKYKPGTAFATNDVRASFDAERMKRDLAEVERLQKEEVPAGVPMSQWALAWCLKNPIVSTLIPGCKNPEQVRANASAAEFYFAANAASMA